MIKNTEYTFITSCIYDAPVSLVWDTLMKFDQWKTWWKGVRKLKVDNTGQSPVVYLSIGYPWYSLSIILRMKDIVLYQESLFSSEGDLVGEGKFIFKASRDTTSLSFYWDVATTKKWMNVTAPVLKPIFKLSHTFVMRSFVHGLARQLKAHVSTIKYHS